MTVPTTATGRRERHFRNYHFFVSPCGIGYLLNFFQCCYLSFDLLHHRAFEKIDRIATCWSTRVTFCWRKRRPFHSVLNGRHLLSQLLEFERTFTSIDSPILSKPLKSITRYISTIFRFNLIAQRTFSFDPTRVSQSLSQLFVCPIKLSLDFPRQIWLFSFFFFIAVHLNWKFCSYLLWASNTKSVSFLI